MCLPKKAMILIIGKLLTVNNKEPEILNYIYYLGNIKA